MHARSVAVPGIGAGEHRDGAVRLSSTSGGVVALGTFCALRYGRWAAWPGLPVPVSWLMAPLLVAAASSALSYGAQLREHRAALAEVAASPDADAEANQLSAFETAVALAACEVAEDRARALCHAPPEDVLAWRSELEEVVERQPPQPPDGAFFADLAGFALGVAAAAALRGRVPV